MRLLLASPFILSTFGCFEPPPPMEAAETSEEAQSESPFPLELLKETWVLQVAEEESLKPFLTKGWFSLVKDRNLKATVLALGPVGGLPAARAHLEVAALYRMAAMNQVFSLVEVYGKTPKPSHPLGAQHLLTVSYSVLGKPSEARVASAKMVGQTSPVMPWHQAWADWLASGEKWPPNLASLPFKPPPVKVGGWPEAPVEASYDMPERDGSTATRDMADPAILIILAQWHEDAAKLAAGDQAEFIEGYRAGYRLPVEGYQPASKALPLELLYGSDLLVPGDGAFLADVHGPLGKAAIDKHAQTSLLAAIAKSSQIDGAIDAERATDLASQLQTTLRAMAKEKAGSATPAHEMFSKIAHVGTLRSLALVAEIEGNRETSGRLRLEALDRSTKSRACPVGMLALGAWDASNRYPIRALDIIHSQAKRYPSLEVARYGLNVLGLARTGEVSGETPGM